MMAEKQKQPWIKFFPADWDSDPCLKLASLSAQGLWIRLINIAHHADGFVLLNGQQPTTQDLATIIGKPESEIVVALNELEKFGVFSRKKDGTIYCRRMLRKTKLSGKNTANGSKGGRPKSKKLKENSDLGFENETQLENPSETENHNPPEKPLYSRSYILEARLDNKSLPVSSSAPTPTPAPAPRPLPPPIPNHEYDDPSDEPPPTPPKTVDDLASFLMSFRGDFGMSRAGATLTITGWSKTLGLASVQRGLEKAKSKGWDRKKAIEQLDAWVAGKDQENFKAKPPAPPEPPPPEDPHWVTVRDAMYAEDPENANKTKSFLPMIHSVKVNGTSVKMLAPTRWSADHIEKNYSPRLLELFQVQKPGIEKIEIVMGFK